MNVSSRFLKSCFLRVSKSYLRVDDIIFKIIETIVNIYIFRKQKNIIKS